MASDRRDVLKLATYAIGSGVGLAIAAPCVRLLVDPVGKQIVTTPTTPIDVGALDRIPVGDVPTRVEVVAPLVQDAWTAARDVVLGAAWVRRVAPDQVKAYSAVCPHLGCVVGWDDAKKTYLCPCHDSRFAANGDRMTGPSERGLDELPIAVKDGRLRVTWLRFKMGGSSQEPA
jgi:menaquinol-cytochrome c reductase iron-sulfur subunit